MRNESYEMNDRIWNRVPKSVAQKAFEKGQSVILCPVEMNPASPWGVSALVDKETAESDFERVVNAFEYYNCHAESGRYVKFFVAP
jgi:hypothetical protein